MSLRFSCATIPPGAGHGARVAHISTGATVTAEMCTYVRICALEVLLKNAPWRLACACLASAIVHAELPTTGVH